ncbi:RNB domain-containing ribonuclease [Staphylococcus aureus]
MVISTMMLRSMQQAHYDDVNLGHFGLSAEYYTDFTSPIRRYPDSTVHRLDRVLIEESMDNKKVKRWREIARVSDTSLNVQRRAIEAIVMHNLLIEKSTKIHDSTYR